MKPDRARVLVEGFIAGIIGYAAVALFFAVVNLVSGRSPFHTAAALGGALFYGVRGPAELVIEPGPILAYNGVHLVLSLLAGFVAAWLVFETERHHNLWYFLFFVFLAGFVYSLVAIGIVGAEIAELVSWWSVAVANLAWVIAMGGYLFLTHRGLVRELHEESG